MTTPSWATQIPNSPVHTVPAGWTSTSGVPATDWAIMQTQLRDWIFQEIVTVVSTFIPGLAPLLQLVGWALGVNNTTIGHQNLLDDIVNIIFGWSGSSWGRTDSAEALQTQKDTIAALSAAILGTAGTLQVDFSQLDDDTSLGADFDQTYSGAGTGYWGIFDKAAFWYPVADASRSCVAVYNVSTTTTDYQQVGVAFATTPVYGAGGGQQAHNLIYGRMNAAGTEYVYARFSAKEVYLGCVAGGVNTSFDTLLTGFNFKGLGYYTLTCGTPDGARVFVIKENNTPILTYTEVGTTSVIAADHRYTGIGVQAYANLFNTNAPGDVLAFGFDDVPGPP